MATALHTSHHIRNRDQGRGKDQATTAQRHQAARTSTRSELRTALAQVRAGRADTR